MKILVTNDDGILAGGIRALVEAASAFGEVVVVAPNKGMSAQGHAITINDPIRLAEVSPFGPDILAYECTGTPVDCVKLAKRVVLKGVAPDLCVSGINHGSNAAINIIYSGTMSAAMEAALEGIPAIGFSLLDYRNDADFETAKAVATRMISHALTHGLGRAKLLNVNIPKLPLSEIKGYKICHQAEANWVEDFHEATDPQGRKYYWLTGKFINKDLRPTADVNALEDGYVSIVPCIHDLTDYNAIDSLKGLSELG